MNDPFIHDQAQKWAKDIVGKGYATMELRLSEMYLNAFARPITSEEMDSAISLIETLRKEAKLEKVDVMKNIELWAEYCHIVINAKEFIHLL